MLDAVTLCAGEKSRWSRRCFRRRSHLLSLVSEMWEGSNGNLMIGNFQNDSMAARSTSSAA